MLACSDWSNLKCICNGGVKSRLPCNWFCPSTFSSPSSALLYELLYEKVFDTDVKKIIAELSAVGVTEESNGSSEVSASDSEDDNYRQVQCKS